MITFSLATLSHNAFAALGYDRDKLRGSSGDQGDFNLHNRVVAPEPVSALLFLFGGAGLAAFRSAKKNGK